MATGGRALGAEGVGALALLRRRPQFRALWTALALSYAGSGAATVALTLYVQQTQGTGFAVAAFLIAESAPNLLGPLLGSVADRVDLRRLMIGADLGQAALFALLALLPPFGGLLALAALTATLRTTYAPARNAAIPNLVVDDELLTANGLTGTAFNLYVAIGPLVGGLLYAASGAALVLLVNTVTFLASAWLTRQIPPLPPIPSEAQPEGVLQATRTGLRHALENRLIRTVTLTLLFMFAFLAIDNVALVFLVRDTLDGGGATYGLVSAGFGLGMLLASLTISRGTGIAPARLYLLGLGLSAVFTLLTGLAPVLAVLALFQLACGSGNGIEIIAGDTIYQRYVPPALRARVYGLSSTATALGTGLAMALGGLLLEVASPRAAFLVAGAGALLVTAVAAPALLRAR